ncbi:hypothetical protein TorRG33x02_320380, partial [Trema orientale]
GSNRANLVRKKATGAQFRKKSVPPCATSGTRSPPPPPPMAAGHAPPPRPRCPTRRCEGRTRDTGHLYPPKEHSELLAFCHEGT